MLHSETQTESIPEMRTKCPETIMNQRKHLKKRFPTTRNKVMAKAILDQAIAGDIRVIPICRKSMKRTVSSGVEWPAGIS